MVTLRFRPLRELIAFPIFLIFLPLARPTRMYFTPPTKPLLPARLKLKRALNGASG